MKQVKGEFGGWWLAERGEEGDWTHVLEIKLRRWFNSILLNLNAMEASLVLRAGENIPVRVIANEYEMTIWKDQET